MGTNAPLTIPKASNRRMTQPITTARTNRSPRLLIVDDNDVDFRILKDVFLSTGIPVEVDGADSGESALEYLSQRVDAGTGELPSLILLDLNLPRLSGMDVLRRLKAHAVFKQIPVVMMSSSRYADDPAAACEAGAALYVQKPADLEQLEDLIQALAKTWLKFGLSPHARPGIRPQHQATL